MNSTLTWIAGEATQTDQRMQPIWFILGHQSPVRTQLDISEPCRADHFRGEIAGTLADGDGVLSVVDAKEKVVLMTMKSLERPEARRNRHFTATCGVL